MRPILVSLPSKPLFFIALAVALVLFGRELWKRRQDKGARLSANPLLLVAAALALVRFRSPTASFIPEGGTFALPWLPVPIYAYGVMLGTSMIVGWFLSMRFAKQDGIRPEDAGAIYMWTAVWAIVGARVLYVLTNLSTFAADPVEIIKVNNGGLVAYGGMIGGFLCSIFQCRKRKIPLLQWADVGAPSVVLGTGITRVGCLLFGCDFGARSDLPWAIQFPKGSPAWHRHVDLYGLAPDALKSFPVHPTQVYETLVGLALFGLLMLLRRYRRFSGEVFVGWVLGYGIMRPLIEILRDDDQRGNVGPLSTSQFIGIVSCLLAGALLVQLIRRYRQDPEATQLWLRPVTAAGPTLPAGGAGTAGPKRKKRR
ncbi:MAG TPA: prolipoprotein diacylglyceryl transferase [Polyangia bacterium]|jgi:phosphatidylglycerol:prolipoprotein diacylglycerol transferase